MLSIRKNYQKKTTSDDQYVIYTENNRRRKVTKKYISAGSWTTKENEIYLNFLQSHQKLFQNEFMRRSKKVFRKMSSLLRRRDPQQCRSHHQKLAIKFNGNIDKIVNYLKQKSIRENQKMPLLTQKQLEKSIKLNILKNQYDIEKSVIIKQKILNTQTGISSYQNVDEQQRNQYIMTVPKENTIKIQINIDNLQIW